MDYWTWSAAARHTTSPISHTIGFDSNDLRLSPLHKLQHRGLRHNCSVLRKPRQRNTTSSMLNHWLEWDKWVLTNFDHDRQWFNTLIPPSYESAAATVDSISRLSGHMRLAVRYISVDIHCRDRRYEWDGGMRSDDASVVSKVWCARTG